MLLFSALRTEKGGVFYLGDAAILVFVFSGVLISSTRVLLKGIQRTVWILAAFPLLAVLLDFGNSIPLGDIGRGVGRNVIFSLSVVAGLIVIRSKGWDAWAWVVVCSFIGLPLGAFLYNPDSLSTFETFLKFGGGSGLTIALSILLARGQMRLAAVALVGGAFVFFVGSFRGMAAMCASVSIGFFFFPLSTAKARLKGGVFAACIVVSIVIASFAFPEFNLSSLLDTQVLTAQEASSMERSDLAVSGWAQFLEHPLTGIGTWQHTRNYVSIIGSQEVIGIHSIFIQLACEYGIVGISFVSSVIFINLWALYRLILGDFAVSNFARGGLVWASAMIGYNTLFSPFAGDSRFIYGIIFSGVLAILFEHRKAQPVSNFRSTGTRVSLDYGRDPRFSEVAPFQSLGILN
jgi:hypothetical protein